MVFVGYLFFLKMFSPMQVKQFRNNISLSSSNDDNYRKSVMRAVINWSLIAVFVLLTVIPAVLIANGCNSGYNKYIHVIIAFLFSDVYLFYYAYSKFVLKTPGFCQI